MISLQQCYAAVHPNSPGYISATSAFPLFSSAVYPCLDMNIDPSKGPVLYSDFCGQTNPKEGASLTKLSTGLGTMGTRQWVLGLPDAVPDNDNESEIRVQVDRKKLESMILAEPNGQDISAETFFNSQYNRPDWDPSRRSSGRANSSSRPRPPRFTDANNQPPKSAGFRRPEPTCNGLQFDFYNNSLANREPSTKYHRVRSSDSQSSQPSTPRGSFLPRKTLLDTFVERNDTYWQNRVTVKIDVPFTDHSHVIGRAGKNTQRVMQETGCHIHFPDSNKNNDLDKSNQVTIAGPINTVEKARSEIRQLSPLTVTFELKDLPPGVDPKSVAEHEEMHQLLNEFSDLVCVVRYNRSSGQPFCLLRGSVHQSNVIKQAVLILQKAFCPSNKPLSCSTTIDILSREQETVLGDKNGNNMHLISRRTGALIHFPRSGTSTTFHIKGGIDAILQARKYVVGCLPMTLSFEARGDLPGLQGSNISSINHQLNVSIHKTPKRGSDMECVLIRGMECNAGNLYAARQRICGEDESMATCTDYDFMSDWCRPQTYVAVSSMAQDMQSQLSITTQGVQLGGQGMVISPNNVVSPNIYALSPNTFLAGYMHNYGQQQTTGVPQISPMYLDAPPMGPSHMGHPPMGHPNMSHHSVLQQIMVPDVYTQPPSTRSSNISSLSSQSESSADCPPDNSTRVAANQHLQAALRKLQLQDQKSDEEYGNEVIKGEKSCPTTPPNTPGVNGSNTPLPNDPIPGQSPIASGWLSTVHKIESGDSRDEFRKAPGAERKMNIELVETQAALAMKHRVSPSEVRVPTDSWSGYGLSSSTPANVLMDRLKQDKKQGSTMTPIMETPSSSESTSKVPEPRRLTQLKMQEGVPNSGIPFSESFSEPGETQVFSMTMTTRLVSSKSVDCSEVENVRDFLVKLGLFKYQSVFEQEEIVDLETLVMLNESDLKDLKLPLGARAKIMDGVRQIKNTSG